MRAGGWFDGVIVLRTVAVMGSHVCCDRMVTVKDWRFVPSTGWKIHVTWPDDTGSPTRWMVSVPLHVPSRNERIGVGLTGVLASFPHAPVSIANAKACSNLDRVRVMMVLANERRDRAQTKNIRPARHSRRRQS